LCYLLWSTREPVRTFELVARLVDMAMQKGVPLRYEIKKDHDLYSSSELDADLEDLVEIGYLRKIVQEVDPVWETKSYVFQPPPLAEYYIPAMRARIDPEAARQIDSLTGSAEVKGILSETGG
jgi:hypothetical protein